LDLQPSMSIQVRIVMPADSCAGVIRATIVVVAWS
jgi:hypothetical protein